MREASAGAPARASSAGSPAEPRAAWATRVPDAPPPAGGAAPTWSVACTTIEPAALIEAFVAHHLALGAAEILLFLDEPGDAAGLDLAPGGSVRVIPCDDAHWSARGGGRPDDHRNRQCWNAELAARRLARTDWIAHLDADEMILPRGGRTVADLLAAVPAEVPAVRIGPAERMFVGGWDEAGLDLRGVFKMGGPGLGERLYGRALGKVVPWGLQGHRLGKSFRRTSRRDLRFGIHRVLLAGRDAPCLRPGPGEALLLHLFPASFEDWRAKYRRRLAHPKALAGMAAGERRRFEAYREVLEAEGEEGARRLFERLCLLSRAEADRLVSEGLAVEATLPGREAARAALRPLRGGRRFEEVRRASGRPPGPRAYLVGMDLCGGRDICRLVAARGYAYAHGDGGRIEREFLAPAPDRRPFAAYDGIHLLAGLGLGGDVARLAALDPGAVLILNRRPVAGWLGDHAARRPDGPPPGARRAAWERRLAAVRALGAAGARVLEWKIEVDKPSHVLNRLVELWQASS